jgi:hypothetical protein
MSAPLPDDELSVEAPDDEPDDVESDDEDDALDDGSDDDDCADAPGPANKSTASTKPSNAMVFA